MTKYGVFVPIVGYSYVEVQADDEYEAKQKALDLCCDFDNTNVELQEMYGIEKVAEGNCLHHPYCNISVEECESE